MRVFYSPHYSFPLSPHHQFPMAKYRRVYERLVSEGTLGEADVMPSGPAARETLLRVHTAEYVDRFIEGGLTPAEQRKLGFTWSPELVLRALHATEGTVRAARQALRDGLSGNLAGGSHHAFAGHGEGYCAFNDMPVAIRHLQAEGFTGRVAIVDCDVHQGNGTAALLLPEQRVYTLSLHCQSNYPARKIPGSRDIGLPDGVEDEEYLHLLERELDRLWRGFRPELVFFQAGVDPLATDRLGRLSLTRDGLRHRDALVLRRCLETQTPAVVVLGGGYNRDVEETVDAHADTVRCAKTLFSGGDWPSAIGA